MSDSLCIVTMMYGIHCCMRHGCLGIHECACDALVCIRKLHGATSVEFMEFNNTCMRVHALTIVYGYVLQFGHSRDLESITLYIPCTCVG